MGDLILDGRQYESLLEGAQLTLQILGYSFVLGVVLSLFVGIGRLSHRRWVRGAALVYVELARGISSIVLLFIVAYALPILLDLPQASLVLLASLALGVNMGGYGAELIRGAIQSIPKGQTEATIALNLTTTQRLRHVILPQAMRLILPPMGNLTIEILKGTALVSLVGVTDIMQTASNLWQQQLFAGEGASRPVLYFNALVIYFVIAQVINALFKFAERRVESRFAGGEAEMIDEDEIAEIPGATK